MFTIRLLKTIDYMQTLFLTYRVTSDFQWLRVVSLKSENQIYPLHLRKDGNYNCRKYDLVVGARNKTAGTHEAWQVKL